MSLVQNDKSPPKSTVKKQRAAKGLQSLSESPPKVKKQVRSVSKRAKESLKLADSKIEQIIPKKKKIKVKKQSIDPNES